MLISYNWLKEITEINDSEEDLSNDLTMIGLEVGNIEKVDNDIIIDVELTPNRPDCLSHFGVARDIMAFKGKKFINKYYDLNFSDIYKTNNVPDIKIEDLALCARYCGVIIENVKMPGTPVSGTPVSGTPEWIKERIEKCGFRSVNPIVDITNYVLLEMGHPLHPFDLDKINGKKINVRKAKKKEKILTLDGIERELDEDMLVIADAEVPVALAGIMGGELSSISENTNTILLESAYFNPVSVRKTARKLGLHTEASHRFERGMDYNGVVPALIRTIELIKEIIPECNITGFTDVYPKKNGLNNVNFRVDRLERITGMEYESGYVKNVLINLGFELEESNKGVFNVRIPGYRPDIDREIDLIEEITRMKGVDSVQVRFPVVDLGIRNKISEDDIYDSLEHAKDILVSLGLQEMISYSFRDRSVLETDDSVEIENPLDVNTRYLRKYLTPGIVDAIVRNVRNGNRDIKFFEIGKVFSKSDNDVNEKYKICIGITGSRNDDNFRSFNKEVDYYDLKGIADAFLSHYNIEAKYRVSDINFLKKSIQADILINDNISGFIGQVSKIILDKYKISSNVYILELDFNQINDYSGSFGKFRQLPKFPQVYRDLSLIAKEDINAADIIDEISQYEYVNEVKVIDIYKGDQIKKGDKVITVSISYLSDKKTLNDAEIDDIEQKILRGLNKLNIKLR